MEFAREREELQEKRQRDDYEREQRRLEREERQQVREHEREMKEYELRIEQERTPAGAPDPGASSTLRYPRTSSAAKPLNFLVLMTKLMTWMPSSEDLNSLQS